MSIFSDCIRPSYTYKEIFELQKLPLETKEKISIEVIRQALNLSKHVPAIAFSGCNDPQWPDGCNMNLVRNHIFYYKSKIKDLCDKYNQELPVEYFLPVPPEVDNKYMADMKCPRAERMRKFWHEKITHKCPDYNSEQLTLF